MYKYIKTRLFQANLSSSTSNLNWNTHSQIFSKNIVSQLVYHIDIGLVQDCSFLYAKPWIPGGEISIFTAVIH